MEQDITLDEAKELVKKIVTDVTNKYMFETIDKLDDLYNELEKELSDQFDDSVKHLRNSDNVIEPTETEQVGGEILIRNDAFGQPPVQSDGTLKELTIIEWGYKTGEYSPE